MRDNGAFLRHIHVIVYWWQFLILDVDTSGLLVAESRHFPIQIYCIEILTIWVARSANAVIVVLKFESLDFMHLGCSLLYDFALLPYTEAFEVIKANTKFLIDVAWLEASGIHV